MTEKIKMFNRMMKDKRGDVTITILVVGVFMLCTAAIFSFYLAEKDFDRTASTGLDILEELNSQVDRAYSSVLGEEFKENPFDIQRREPYGDGFRTCFYLEEPPDDKQIFYARYCRVPPLP